MHAEDVTAGLLAGIVDGVAERQGARPGEITLAYPAWWGPEPVALLLDALRAHGLPGVLPVAAPLAAAATHHSRSGPIAVVDLGTDLCVSVVSGRATPGPRRLLGRPVTVPHLAGAAFDDAVLARVRAVVGPAWDHLDPSDLAVRHSAAVLRRRCTLAKERLGREPTADVAVELPGIRIRVQLTRGHFEELVRPAFAEAVAALGKALDTAGLGVADLDAVVLAGGSARIPLAAQVFADALGRPIAHSCDPGVVTVLGAAMVARGGDPAPRVPVLPVVGTAVAALPGAPPPPPPTTVTVPPPRSAPARPLGVARTAASIAVAATFGLSLTVASTEVPASPPTAAIVYPAVAHHPAVAVPASHAATATRVPRPARERGPVGTPGARPRPSTIPQNRSGPFRTTPDTNGGWR
jgi:hypothetical protein